MITVTGTRPLLFYLYTMKLLVVTQKVDHDDENLGAFYRWWEKLAPHTDAMTILCRSAGDVVLPPQVTVATFGADKKGPHGKIGRFARFMELLSRHYRQSDTVLFHQIPEFVLAAAPVLKTIRRRSLFWYAHGAVTWRLKLAERLVDTVITSSADGFRLPSKKVIYTGQAIDTEVFRPGVGNEISGVGIRDSSPVIRLITIGRISPVKDYETMLRAFALLRGRNGREWTLSIVGGPLTVHDAEYLALLKKQAVELNVETAVTFFGPRPYGEIPKFLNAHDVFLNLSSTGSLDKAVLEAMACGRTVLTANGAYRDILPSRYFVEHTSPEFVAGRLGTLADDVRPNEVLRRIVVENHSLDRMMTQLVPLLGGAPLR